MNNGKIYQYLFTLFLPLWGSAYYKIIPTVENIDGLCMEEGHTLLFNVAQVLCLSILV